MVERSQAAEARRLASDLARSLGFSETRAAEVAIAVTEAGNNLAFHAVSGELIINATCSPDGTPVLDMFSIDRGPGMDLDRCMVDGYSTAGTSGTGMGAMRRIASEFDAWSSAAGTVLFARFSPERPRQGGLCISGIRVPKSGERVCGDDWCVREIPGGIGILVADGLGHGQFAAEASGQAVTAFLEAPWYGAADMTSVLHAALRGTRGAAIAIAAIDLEARRVKFSGLGNISAVVCRRSGETQNMVSLNGTAGHNAPKIAEFDYPWPDAGVLILHSDGIATSWNLGKYPGLVFLHPALAAGVLYRDFTRGRDDATVVAFSERCA